MARTMSVPCRRDLACYRNDGHPGDHAYATPDTVPSPAPIWQAGYDAGYREAQEDIAAGVQVTGDAGLREAAQAVFDLWDDGDLDPSDGMYQPCLDAFDALRAALATEEKP